MDAAGLQSLYIDELRRSLVPPTHPMVNGRQTETLIRRAECEAAAACTAADAVTWVWSDLHLGHEHSRSQGKANRAGPFGVVPLCGVAVISRKWRLRLDNSWPSRYRFV